MILRIQKSRGFKLVSAFLVLNILAEIAAPTTALALTGGPKQPEFSSFTPIGVSDMVDLSSGDMNYNIPLMDVGGYPLNIAYSSELGMDDEASWVGLGWNLSVGQINRSVRGLPDDFNGDEMIYENNMKDNITAGASFKVTPNLFGVDLSDDNPVGVSVSLGVTATYNNYNGFTMKSSVGVQMDLGSACSVGFNAENGPDGLSLSPSVSIHAKKENKDKSNTSLTGTVGVTMNSRQGLTATTLNMTKSRSSGSKKTNDYVNYGSSSTGSSIGFTDELYTPSKRVAMNTESFTVNAAIGAEAWGVEGQGQITAFGTIQSIDESELHKIRAAYGYENTDNSDKYGILDFNREKDGSFNVNTTNLPLTNYTYDIYSVQGQGVSGTYRPFRNQVGYVYDSYVADGSSSNSLGVEVGMGNAVHGGVDFENTTVESHSGVWESDNDIVQYLKEHYNYNPKYEKVHFKNVGDLSVDEEFVLFDQTARYNPVRIPFVGNKFHRKAAGKLHYKYDNLANESSIGVSAATKRSKRKLRNQSIRNITIRDLKKGVGYGPCVVKTGVANYTAIGFPSGSKDHHTGEVQIIRNDGARYIYGLPLYNFVKKESSFSITGTPEYSKGLIAHNATDNSTSNSQLNKNFNRTITPAYVHTYLLTSVLSTDYQDIDNNGPSDNDLGSYTKFTYTDASDYKWRVPYEAGKATYNPGLNTDKDDDEGSVIYGEKAVRYIQKIETKTHIAIFELTDRKDAVGAKGEDSETGSGAKSKKLSKIYLYSKPEYLALGSAAKPIKTVNFEYSYSLCPNVPNFDNASALLGDEKSKTPKGKLTLKKIYFTYRDSKMGKYTGYRFNYHEYADGKDEYTGGALVLDNVNNPEYNIKGYDSWGKYKPSAAVSGANTDPVTAAEYSFTDQDRSVQNPRSSVWCLKNISTPSGGQISVEYESDDYNYVQDKKPLMMYKVVGAGENSTPVDNGSISAELFEGSILKKHNKYIYVEVPLDADCIDGAPSPEIRSLFTNGLEESNILQFRFFVNMTKQGGNDGSESNINASNYDYVSGYCRMNLDEEFKCEEEGGRKFISIPLKFEEREGNIGGNKDVNPIAKAAWSFGRKYLSQQVYGTAPNGNPSGIQQIVEQMVASNTLQNLKEIFTGPNATLEDKSIGRRFVKDKSWVRLGIATPSGTKLGGGCRVKSVRISDVWGEDSPNSMNPGQTGYKTMNYGQSYKYTLSDAENALSSGVATYEPVGNKENPFVQPVVATIKHLLAPKDENYVEKPFGESFFPSPQVTYSRVSVANISGASTLPSNMQVKKLHKTGKVVTEFYTSRDYPTIVDQTKIQAKEDKKNPLASLLKIEMKKHFTASQGYVVHLNDMNGKQKAQWVYAEGQEKPISGVTYHYASDDYYAANPNDRNKGKLNNNVPVVFPNGDIKKQVIGVEYDLVHDLRENGTNTQISGVNTNLAAFFVGVFPGLVPIPLPDFSSSEDQVRAVSSTKVINTFGILVETVAYDGDTKVSTKNIGWDAMTGEVLATETVDEYNDKYYTFNYPAHWFYKGMSQASINLGVDGKLGPAGSSSSYIMQGLPSAYMSADFLMVGDEIAYTDGAVKKKAWVDWVQGNTFRLIDMAGNGIASISSGTDFTVVRSARRNLQSAGIMNVTMMHHPFKNQTGDYITNLGTGFLMGANYEQWKIINAGAVDYSDDWPAGCECGLTDLNRFVKNERGVWRVKSSNTYLTGRNVQAKVTPRMEGFFTTFSPMYKLTGNHTWYKDVTDWTWVSQVSNYSAYGFEIENMDALNRYSGAQYGYSNTLPIAVGANTKYHELGFDGFEDRGFEGCTTNSHFSFPGSISGTQTATGYITRSTSHTGKHSIRVNQGENVIMNKKIACPVTAEP